MVIEVQDNWAVVIDPGSILSGCVLLMGMSWRWTACIAVTLARLLLHVHKIRYAEKMAANNMNTSAAAVNLAMLGVGLVVVVAAVGIVAVAGIGWDERLKMASFMTGVVVGNETVIVAGIENELEDKNDEMV